MTARAQHGVPRLAILTWVVASVGCGDATCDPISAPNEACYAQNRDPASAQVALATEVAHRFIEEHPAEEQHWDWQPGVLMFAMTELYRVTGDGDVHEYYRSWLDYHLGRGYQIVWSDSCPPALTALSLYKETNEPRYRQVLDDVLEYLRSQAQRTPEGGISHLGIIQNPTTLWVDSLFMFGMVLNRWGEFASDPDLLDLMSEQLSIFSDLMQQDGGAFVHAHYWPFPSYTEGYWARGNAWITASVADYLRVRTLRREHDLTAEAIFDAHLNAIVGMQDDDTGKWWTIMNRPGEIYLETSATALFAYGMARAYRYGVVGEEVLDSITRALAGVQDAIVRDGTDRPIVTGISGPTTVGTFESYAAVPLLDDLDFGVGAAILALIETSGLDLTTSSP